MNKTSREPARLAKDEEAAFVALVGRESRFAFRVAYAVLRNSHDAEDAVQESFLKLFRRGGWGEIEDERAYLARTVWRCAVDRLRKSEKPERPGENLDEVAEAVTPESDPEQAALTSDWQAAVHRLVDRLPEELRQPLVLSAIDELKSREIAGILGIPEGTVRPPTPPPPHLLNQKPPLHS